MYTIKIDDDQFSVYSLKIADLILWIAAEIETLSKELYKMVIDNDADTDNKKFDYDCLTPFIERYSLSNLVVQLTSSFVDLSDNNRKFTPFKICKRAKGKATFKWNDAYQNLKHDKTKSIKTYGQFVYLCGALSALYLLNIYYYFECKRKIYEAKHIVSNSIDKNEIELLSSSVLTVLKFRERPFGHAIKIISHKFEESVYCEIFWDYAINKQKSIIEKCSNDTSQIGAMHYDEYGQATDNQYFLQYIDADKMMCLNRGKVEMQKWRQNPIDFDVS